MFLKLNYKYYLYIFSNKSDSFYFNFKKLNKLAIKYRNF